jgi:ABC-type uncharacterized transport system permease subunit
MTRLTVLCFAGTYALALVAEVLRFRPGGGPPRGLSLGLMGLGWAVHATYLAELAIQRHALPLTNSFESTLVLGWLLVAVALYLVARPGRTRPTIAGLVVLLLALGVVSVAGLWVDRAGDRADWRNALTVWGVVHGLFQTLGALATSVAFVFGVLYLVQSRRLKRKRSPGEGVPLPSLEQAERWHRGAILCAFGLLSIGLATGLGLVLATRRNGQSGLRWSDPKVLGTVALWLVCAALAYARYRPDWQGRRVMILTVVAFGLLAFALIGAGLLLPTGHGGLATLQAGPPSAGATGVAAP